MTLDPEENDPTPEEALSMTFLLGIVFMFLYVLFTKWVEKPEIQRLEGEVGKVKSLKKGLEKDLERLSETHGEEIAILKSGIEKLKADNEDLARPLESHKKDFNERLKEQESKIGQLETCLKKQSEQHRAEIAEKDESLSALEDTSKRTIADLKGWNKKFVGQISDLEIDLKKEREESSKLVPKLVGKASDLEHKLKRRIFHIQRLREAIDILDPERIDVKMLQANKFRVVDYEVTRDSGGGVEKDERDVRLVTILEGVDLFDPDDIVFDEERYENYNVYAGGEFRLPTPLAERIMDCMEKSHPGASQATSSIDPESWADDDLYKMKVEEELSFGEIAHKTGLTRGQIKGRFYRFANSLENQPETPESHLRTTNEPMQNHPRPNSDK